MWITLLCRQEPWQSSSGGIPCEPLGMTLMTSEYHRMLSVASNTARLSSSISPVWVFNHQASKSILSIARSGPSPSLLPHSLLGRAFCFSFLSRFSCMRTYHLLYWGYQIYTGAIEIVQGWGHLPYVQPMLVWSLALHIVPSTLPVVIAECRIRNNPWSGWAVIPK